jgi:hypothetical protein
MSTVPDNAQAPPPGAVPVAQPTAVPPPPAGASGTVPVQTVYVPVSAPPVAPSDAAAQAAAAQQAEAAKLAAQQAEAQQAAASEHRAPQTVYVFSHSNFFYWWPVWVVGFIMALVTFLWGQKVNVGGAAEMIHPSKNLGVIFTLTLFLVILITNVTVRGLASVLVILGAAFAVLLVAYLGWWDTMLGWFSLLSIHMNLGFYVFFSTLIFVVWAVAVFGYDRLHYWRVTPGQITHDYVIGGAAKSYDTRGMVFEKHRQDLFRHWVLGMGSGDIEISTMGAKREHLTVPNVLFVDAKVSAIQRLIAMSPDEFAAPPH